MKTSISQEEFMKKPQKEQNYLIFGAVEGHEARIGKLEKQRFLKTSVSFLGGILGGIIAAVGLK